MDEEIDEHLPSGFAEQLLGTDQLAPQYAPAHRRSSIVEGIAYLGRPILGRAQCERHIFRRPARDAIAVGDMVGGSRSDDDMIKYFHVERPANLIELAGDRDILIARARVAARMIVDENDRSGIEFERAPEDCPGIDRKLRKGSVLERSEEHTSELQSLMRISYAVFCLQK